MFFFTTVSVDPWDLRKMGYQSCYVQTSPRLGIMYSNTDYPVTSYPNVVQLGFGLVLSGRCPLFFHDQKPIVSKYTPFYATQICSNCVKQNITFLQKNTDMNTNFFLQILNTYKSTQTFHLPPNFQKHKRYSCWADRCLTQALHSLLSILH